jgi:hypothetical protein
MVPAETDRHTQIHKTVVQTFRHEFLSHIMTGDETCLHHFEHKMKRHSMEWHHVNSLKRKEKFKAGTVMATVF